MISTGLASLMEDLSPLRGRRFGVLAHQASVTPDLRPIHLALLEAGCRPAALFAPEHGYYGVEQDMVAAVDTCDCLSGAPIRSLYGEDAESLRPSPDAFDGLDLLIVDLQDVGARYYTFPATAVWAAEAALEAGCEVWVLDRPNPLGGEVIEGDLPRPGYESFVSAFRMPVRHGLTLAEIMTLEGRRRGWAELPRVWPLAGWRRDMSWEETGLPWIAPSPNMPTPLTALLYPGGCLIEATEFSEGRGTTRPFQLIGSPQLQPLALVRRLQTSGLAGVGVVPTYFRPQHQKHRGELCAGIELVVTDARRLAPYRLGVELLAALRGTAPASFRWRTAPYEFVIDRPAIDLLTGGPECRSALDSGSGLGDWIATWNADQNAFREERREALLYPETPPPAPA